MGHPDTLGNASLILVLTDRVTATSLSLGEASRSVCRRCWQEKRAELSQRHTYGAPSEGREAHEIATPLTLPIYILTSANYEPVTDS